MGLTLSNGLDFITDAKKCFDDSKNGIGSNENDQTNEGVGDVFLSGFYFLGISG